MVPFNIMQILFPLFFTISFSIIVLTLIKSLFQWNKNNHSPQLSVEAVIVSNRILTRTMQSHSSSTTYYITCEVESGDRMEFVVDGMEYGLLAEKDKGKLTFQGTRFLSFERYK